MTDTWNAQDADTDPNATVVYERTHCGPSRAEWIEEHGPLIFLDAIAIVGCSVVIAKALGLL